MGNAYLRLKPYMGFLPPVLYYRTEFAKPAAGGLAEFPFPVQPQEKKSQERSLSMTQIHTRDK